MLGTAQAEIRHAARRGALGRLRRRRRQVELTLDLAPIRRGLGEKWAKAAPSVRRFATLVIERHLMGAYPSYTLTGDVFIIRLAGMSRREADAARHDIEAELQELLFGSRATTHDRPQRTARRARKGRGRLARMLAQLGRALSPARLRFGAFRTRGGRSVPPQGGATSGPGGSDAPARPLPPAVQPAGADPRPTWWRDIRVPDRIPRSGGVPVVAAGQGPVAASAGLAPRGDSVGGQATEAPAGPVAGSSRVKGRVRRAGTDALERALYAAIVEAQYRNDLVQRTRLFPPMGTRFLFRPLWHIGRGFMPIYTCTPACALGPFEFVTGDALLPKNVGAGKIAMLDEMLLDHVARELRSRQPGQLQSLVCIPVHYETLVGERAAAWIALLETIPRLIRSSIIVEIVNVSQGVGQLATYSLVRKLKAHVRSVVGRLELGDVNFRVWRQTDLAVVGIDVELDERPEIDVINEINHFAAPAKQHGLRTYVRGLRSLSLAAAAIASGVDYIDGPAVSDGDFVLPAVPTSFGIFDIYSDV